MTFSMVIKVTAPRVVVLSKMLTAILLKKVIKRPLRATKLAAYLIPASQAIIVFTLNKAYIYNNLYKS